jgi:hypothetical protein
MESFEQAKGLVGTEIWEFVLGLRRSWPPPGTQVAREAANHAYLPHGGWDRGDQVPKQGISWHC